MKKTLALSFALVFALSVAAPPVLGSFGGATPAYAAKAKPKGYCSLPVLHDPRFTQTWGDFYKCFKKK